MGDHDGAEVFDWLRLIRSRRVGPATFWRLMGEHGSVGAALAALPDVARAAGVADYAPCPEGVVRAEMRAGAAAGARLIHAGMEDYPAALRDLADAPPVLWVIGDTCLLTRPMVAIVGARNASSLGVRMARMLAAGLAAAGYAVVSGMARGIDGAAHGAALTAARAAGGGTIAVQAGGIDVVYPPEHAALAAELGLDGLRLSECAPGTQPLARHFPARNRLISGLSRAVVVVEAAARSGSLITARDALDQGREVLVVPGHPLDARAGGCNLLIREGATLVRGVEDVLEVLARLEPEPLAPRADNPGALATSVPPSALRAAPQGTAPSAPEGASAQTHSATFQALREPAARERGRDQMHGQARTWALHQQILDRLGPSPLAEDQLIRDLALPAAAVMPEIVTLELEGRIERQAGGLLSRPN